MSARQVSHPLLSALSSELRAYVTAFKREQQSARAPAVMSTQLTGLYAGHVADMGPLSINVSAISGQLSAQVTYNGPPVDLVLFPTSSNTTFTVSYITESSLRCRQQSLLGLEGALLAFDVSPGARAAFFPNMFGGQRFAAQ